MNILRGYPLILPVLNIIDNISLFCEMKRSEWIRYQHTFAILSHFEHFFKYNSAIQFAKMDVFITILIFCLPTKNHQKEFFALTQ